MRYISLLLLCFMMTASVIACPVCYGAADNDTMNATNTAIITLLCITGIVLSGIIGFGLYIRKRSRNMREQVSGTAYVDEKGHVHLNKKGAFEWNNS